MSRSRVQVPLSALFFRFGTATKGISLGINKKSLHLMMKAAEQSEELRIYMTIIKGDSAYFIRQKVNKKQKMLPLCISDLHFFVFIC